MQWWRRSVAAAVLCVGLGTGTARADVYYENAGWGLLTVLTNVVYMPAKVSYAALGGLTGALALACTGGDFQVAENVWTAALGGTYVITPRMLRGEDPIAFAGTPGGEVSADSSWSGSGLSEQQLGGS